MLNFALMGQFRENCYLKQLLALLVFCRNVQLKGWWLKSKLDGRLYCFMSFSSRYHSSILETSRAKATITVASTTFKLRVFRVENLIVQVCFAVDPQQQPMRQNPCDPACVVTCNFGADDVKSRLSGGFVRMFETRARKRWQLAHPRLLTVQEPCDDTPSSRSARRCQVFMPGCTWVNLWWRRWSKWGPSITSVDISGFWLQWWQDLWCRESDSGIQTVLRNVSVHGAYEEQSDNKPAIITSSGCLALAWHEQKPAGGWTQLSKLSNAEGASSA